MARDDVIYLIKEAESAHGVHVQVERNEREVFCKVRSVGRSEFYTALNAGLRPEYVFEIAVADEYEGERRLRYRDRILDVVRTYEPENSDGIEITAGRSDDG